MSTFDEFKEFIKDKEYLKQKVKKGQTSWQELYERYDLYGKDDDIFKKEKNNNKNEDNKRNEDGFSSFMNMISGIDVDKISEGLNGMKKILNILSELTVGDEISSSKRRSQQPYKRDDD